jgi:hypothetical protein
MMEKKKRPKEDGMVLDVCSIVGIRVRQRGFVKVNKENKGEQTKILGTLPLHLSTKKDAHERTQLGNNDLFFYSAGQ